MITSLAITNVGPVPTPGTILSSTTSWSRSDEGALYLVVKENTSAPWNMPDPDRTRHHIKVVCLNGCRCGFIPVDDIKDYSIVGHLDICTDADKGN